MNKNLFRIVFNKHRGQMMVVAENSSSTVKASNSEGNGGSALPRWIVSSLRAVSVAVLASIGVVCLSVSTAYGQIIADPNAAANQRATLLQTANGVPQVNIQAPSAAGVSRNIYSQFDVQSNGAILNNSRTNVQTQQGGWVQGNPWLAAGSARVILNEVNSSNPSQLKGYVEVAGQRDDVVIANPAGISDNGGGFINTSKATLTTGTPIVNGGNLDGYRVQGGNISINGNGLDLSSTDYAAILARAVQVNAGIWANELKVVTGANQIDASSLVANTTPVATPIAGTGATPTYALDVAQIGGMYAGKIHLIGTEQGLGVRSAGTIGATGGDLVLQNNGWLTSTGTLRANGNLSISVAGNLENSSAGVIAATGDVTLNTTTDINNAGLISASNTLTVSSSNLSNSVTAELSGTTALLSSSNVLTNRGLIDGIETQLNATTLKNIGTGAVYGDHVSIKVNTLLNDVETVTNITKAGTIAARKRLDIAVDTLTNREHGLIFSAGDMAIGEGLDANRQATGQATTLNNNSATIEALGNLDVGAKTVNNTNDHFTYEIRLASQDDNASETISSTYYRTFVRKIYLPFNTSTDPANILAGGNLTLRSDTVTNMDSHIVAGGVLTNTGVNMVNADVTATKKIHDLGLNHNYVYVPESGYCGYVKYNCVPAHYEWQTSPYESIVESTVFVPQPSAPLLSGKTITSVTAGSVSTSPLLPTSSMFQINAGATSSYLITTDPRFTDRNLWLGSDFMTSSMSFDPAISQKRLGDGFYEQKLIREQVAQLTGRRFLGDYTSDQEEYQALMTNGLTTASTLNLRPGVALTAEQMAQLTSDIVWIVEQSVNLPDGTTQKVLVPQVYVQVRDGDLSNSGALISGKEVDIKLSGDLTNSGSIVGTGQGMAVGRKVVKLNAETINNFSTIQGDSVGVTAATDLNNEGGSIRAVSSLNATAGRDLNIETSTRSSSTDIGANNFSRTTIDRVAGLYVTGINGTLVASAGRDISLVAGVVSNTGSGETTLSAANNVSLSSVTTKSSDRDVWDTDNYRKSSSSQEVGSQVAGGGKVNLNAGNDTNVRASTVQAKESLSANAGGSVNVIAGQSSSSLDEAHKFSSSDFLSSSTLVTRETNNSTTAQASNLGGATVAISTGADINVKGSSVVSDNATALTAANNINLEAAQNTSSASSFRQETTSGLMSSGGIGVSIGTRKQSTDGKDTTTTAAASTVGSVGGNVNIQAGAQYKQVGSDVITTTGDISITAKTIEIQEARETNKQSSEQKFEQSGLTLAVTSGLVSSVQSAQNQLKASSQTNDNRMKALAAVNAATNAVQAAQNATKLDASASIGTSSSQSNQTNQSDTARGSTIASGATTTLKATGAGQVSNLTIQGSDVSGKTVNLEADNQVNLLAAQNNTLETSSNKSSSASAGVSIGTSGLGVVASASLGKGSGNGADTSYTNTHVAGVDQVNIKSGADTTLQGATVEAKQITATVGGNLNIESLQDSSTYTEANKQAGGSLFVGLGTTGPVIGNLNLAKSNIDSSYASVTEQSSIKAGNGGFNINVQGNTDLKGGAITSTQAAVDNNKNTFQTGGTLSTSDIQNKAAYDANSLSVTVGTGSTPGQSASAGMSGIGFGKDSGSASSITTAGISGVAGDSSKRTGDKEQGINQIFNKDQVKAEINAQTAITSEFGKNASKAVGDYAQTKLDEAKANNDQAGIAAWSEGGPNRVALHTLVGGLTGGVQGAVGAGTSQAAIDQIGQAIKDTDLPVALKQTLVAAAGTAIGAATGGTAGAASGFNATVNNYISHSPFTNVRRTVNQENARLTSECGVNCTAEDFKRIDQQMVKLEIAGNLAMISQTNKLTTEQAVQFGESVAALLPVYGTPIALYQAITGESLTGQDLSTAERVLNTAAAALPLGSAAYKVVTSAAQDMSKMSASIGAVQGFKSADELNGLMGAFNKAPAWKEGTQIAEATMQPGTKVQMVVNKEAYDQLGAGNMNFVGNWASFDNVPNQAFARNNLAITKGFKEDVGYVVELEITKPVNAQIGVVGSQGAATGGASQLNFLFEQRNGGEFFKLISRKELP